MLPGKCRDEKEGLTGMLDGLDIGSLKTAPPWLLGLLTKAVDNQVSQGLEGIAGVVPFCDQGYLGAFRGSQHEHPHDALAVDFTTIAANAHVRLKPSSQCYKLRCRASVQTEAIGDGDRFFHSLIVRCLNELSGRETPSIPPDDHPERRF